MDEQTNLIETLRFCATNGDCRDCPCDFQCEGTMGNGLYTRAADALEDVSKRADELGEELTAAMELVHKRDEKIEQLKADLLSRGKNVVEWISAEKRLPPENQAFLARCPRMKNTYVGIRIGAYISIFGSRNLINGMEYWMPLPEPPKEELDEV